MPKFPVDATKEKVIKEFELLGFRQVRIREQIAMERENPDGTRTPLTMPNHRRIKQTIDFSQHFTKSSLLLCTACAYNSCDALPMGLQ